MLFINDGLKMKYYKFCNQFLAYDILFRFYENSKISAKMKKTEPHGNQVSPVQSNLAQVKTCK